jgi:hypothetical protein
MAGDRDVIGKRAIGIDAGHCLCTLLVITAGVGEGDIPAAVVGTRDDGGCGSSGQGDNGSNGETHVGDFRSVRVW